jgi:signal transduction histidine kinase
MRMHPCGIHPSILAEGGIAPALRTLARRSVVPVELELNADGRLPEQIEVAAYYVVSESLTNIAKHAHATVARLSATLDSSGLRIRVTDDGRGGADTTAGSGLIGLQDRVEAVGGSLSISSLAGSGTAVAAIFPRERNPVLRYRSRKPRRCSRAAERDLSVAGDDGAKPSRRRRQLW